MRPSKRPGKDLSKPARQEVKSHLNVRLLPILVLALAILYILTGFRGWLVFFIGTAGAWLIAYIWARSLGRSLSIERNIRLAWPTVGEAVPGQVKLSNHSWLPVVWVEITDESSSLETPWLI